ncbi:TetR/AcrR family transcriptional regulator [Shimia sp. R9_1]|uniref:TetR/AcrR family transcriptional regulator n=1 Tax=unclassified Shimia TaxID=2630038 RepID=UPI001ADCB501|nr:MULTISPECIES: TetR/AcrR family transcriptional regulator [unclassified Shimia]MBO9395121.1 TetR/AcrR family transcriptional regulator [Shimia sp. R9_2]MBO9399235.1 TetR/AcrR family transcriptional regulator [Shimia sp. R9_3]MBO9407122.1 TetR/AcrR family transcriptional regulator [Shimia sp. R9_1]
MREKILEATAAMLVAHGTQASMSKIAQRAGVATGSLYNHFENKDVLIRAVYDDLAAVMAEALTAGDDPSQPALTRLERYIDNHIDFIWQDADRAVLFEYLSNVPLLPGADVMASFEKSASFIAGVLRQLQDEGGSIAGDPGVMGGFIGGAIRNTLKWQRAQGKPLSDETRAQLRDMCLRSVQAGA